MSKLRTVVKKLVWRYVKYNIVGLTVFALSIALYYGILFPLLGEPSYIVVSIIGGIIEFSLLTYINKTKKGVIFESCLPIDVAGPKTKKMKGKK